MYTTQQKMFFARELARAGGNVTAAAKELREQYETLRDIGESTLRRYLKEPGAAEQIAAASQALNDITAVAIAQCEREKILNELRGSEMDRLAKDERIFDELQTLVGNALKEAVAAGDESKLAVGQIAALYERMARVLDGRRQRLLPMVSNQGDFSLAMRIIAEEAQRVMGEKAPGFIKKIRERYLAEAEKNVKETAAA